MGKLKRGRRSQKSRINPVARKSGMSKQDLKDETTRQKKIIPLISKLSSSAPNDRSMGLSAIMVLAEDATMRRLLLKERLVQTIMEQTLNDLNDEIVVELFGLLRNLTLEEGHEVAKYLWRSNIWAAIEKALDKIESSFEFLNSNSDKKVQKKRALMLYDFTENLLSLIVAIASSSEELYDHVYQRIDRVLNLVVILLSFNSPELKTSLKLFNALLDLVYEFASESSEFIEKLQTNEKFSLEHLSDAMNHPSQGKNRLGKVYIEGIRYHMYEVDPETKREASKETACLAILASVFQTVSGVHLEDIHKNITTTSTEPVQKEPEDARGDKPKDIDVPFGGASPEKVQALADLQAIDVTIDLFTTVCEYLAINENAIQEPVQLGGEIVDLLLNTAYPSCLHLLKFDLEHKDELGLTQKVLTAINNLSWLFVSNETIPVAWYNCALELWDVVENASNDGDLESQRLCLNALWALSKCLGQDVQRKVNAGAIKSLLNKCQELARNPSSGEDSNEVALALEFVLSCVGFVGVIAQTIGDVEITRQIGDFLLEAIGTFSRESPFKKHGVEIVIESLNLIYDIFGDAEYAYDMPVFVQGGYLARLELLEPAVRSCCKKVDKNRDPEQRARAEEAWNNLARFIEYKRHERD